MNISSSPFSLNLINNNLGNLVHPLPSSTSPWSGIILAASLTALAGIGFWRWMQIGKGNDTPQDAYFERAKNRVTQAYCYVFGGFACSLVTAALTNSVSISNFSNPYFILQCAIPLGVAGYVAAFTDKTYVKTKHIALAIFHFGLGLLLPRYSLMAQVAAMTLGSLLIFTSYMAPDKQFLEWQGPLISVLATLSVVSFTGRFFPKTILGGGVISALYEGVWFVGGLLMIDNLTAVENAKKIEDAQYDPIKNYFTSLNAFFPPISFFSR